MTMDDGCIVHNSTWLKMNDTLSESDVDLYHLKLHVYVYVGVDLFHCMTSS
jgi:hypothetical protein